MAVAFFLRNLSIPINSLDIYVPCGKQFPLYDFLELEHSYQKSGRPTPPTSPQGDHVGEHLHVRTVLKYTHHNCPPITILESLSSSAYAPIARLFASHMVTFVSMDVFGAAFPELLFEHRSLLGYQEDASLMEQGVELGEYWRGIGVDVRLDGGFWNFKGGGICRRYACASEIRSFFDKGSLFELIGHTTATRELTESILFCLDFHTCDQYCHTVHISPRSAPRSLLLERSVPFNRVDQYQASAPM